MFLKVNFEPMRFAFFVIFITHSFLSFNSRAQLPAIGNWRDHLPYAQAIQVAKGSDKIWCATPYSIFSIDIVENSIDRLSKVNGLSETGVRSIGWSAETNSLLVAYNNSNIDVIRSAGIKNINSIKNTSQSGDKNIYHIFSKNMLAYLSTGIGILVLDLKNNEIKDTYIIGDGGIKTRINAVSIDNNFIYAATAEGLKKAALTSPNLQDYRNWQRISGSDGLPPGEVKQIITINNQVVVLLKDSLFIQNNTTWNYLYADGWKINSMDAAAGKLLVNETQNNSGKVVLINTAGTAEQIIQNNTFTRIPLQSISVNNEIWIADASAGLSKYSSNSFQSYIPDSPLSTADGEMKIQNGILWVAAGSILAGGQPAGNKNGLYRFSENSWKNSNRSLFPAMDTLPDCITVSIDRKDGTVWAGSYHGGLLSITSNNILTVYKQNSPIQASLFSPGSYRVSGLAIDQENNLWVANYGAAKNLHVRKADGNWQSFSVPFPLSENAVSAIVIDDLNQKWIIAPNGQGLICYNQGTSIDNTSDDRWKWYRSGKGDGNLPDNNVLCMVTDKNSFIWVGTKQGIGIIQCPQDIFNSQGCEAIFPIVQQDNFAGYLFRDEEVQCMAVDGADRKWVGTKNGAWLISADGEKTIYRFTTANSPLPANDIKQIVVDEKTGEVFFSTTLGIVSFRSTATAGGTKNEDVLVFPNPVPPGYTGTIAIRGLVNNAIVKITELDGRLVYQTRALGGQATWNGKNYKGQTISSGVYMVLVNDDNKKEKFATKIIFISK